MADNNNAFAGHLLETRPVVRQAWSVVKDYSAVVSVAGVGRKKVRANGMRLETRAG